MLINGGYAAKINAAVRVTDEPLVFLGADDLEPQPGWLEAAVAAMRDGVEVVGVNDMIDRPHRPQHATHFLLTRAYAERPVADGERGPLSEAYVHSFVDDECIATATRRGAYAYEPSSRVAHLHRPPGTRRTTRRTARAAPTSTGTGEPSGDGGTCGRERLHGGRLHLRRRVVGRDGAGSDHVPLSRRRRSSTSTASRCMRRGTARWSWWRRRSSSTSMRTTFSSRRTSRRWLRGRATCGCRASDPSRAGVEREPIFPRVVGHRHD